VVSTYKISNASRFWFANVYHFDLSWLHFTGGVPHAFILGQLHCPPTSMVVAWEFNSVTHTRVQYEERQLFCTQDNARWCRESACMTRIKWSSFRGCSDLRSLSGPCFVLHSAGMCFELGDAVFGSARLKNNFWGTWTRQPTLIGSMCSSTCSESIARHLVIRPEKKRGKSMFL
jgi:hypothetical protein